MSPKRLSASARAARSGIPCSTSSRVSMATWKSSSAATSSSTEERQRSEESWRPKRPAVGTRASWAPLGGEEDRRDGGHELGEALRLRLELAATGGRELVEARLAAELRHPPLRVDPPLPLHAVERRVERALLHLDGVGAGIAQPSGDGVAVARSPGEGAQNEGVERSVQAVLGGSHRALP